MQNEKIIQVLQEADLSAGKITLPVDLAETVKRRAQRRYYKYLAVPAAAAAVILTVFYVQQFTGNTRQRSSEIAVDTQGQNKIETIEENITQLEAKVDRIASQIDRLLEYESRQRNIRKLKAKQANISDPLMKLDNQVDKTAFILIYQADQLYRELNLEDSAVEVYNRIIELFPENRWAEVAKERLIEIQKNKQNDS